MTRLFGIPMGPLEVVLVAMLFVAFVTLGLLAARNRIFFRLGVRNVRRRPGRSALIVVGLMLGTAIIARRPSRRSDRPMSSSPPKARRLTWRCKVARRLVCAISLRPTSA